MRKKTLDRDIVTLLVFTLFTIVSWVGFEVYRAYTHRAPAPQVDQTYLQSFDTTLDTKVLQQLEARTP